jgi:hypothetical protein
MDADTNADISRARANPIPTKGRFVAPPDAPIKSFADFHDNSNDRLQGEKDFIENMIGKEIIIYGYRIADSRKSKNPGEFCLTLQFRYADNAGMPQDKTRVVFTGSRVLMEQIEAYKANIPFSTIVIKNETGPNKKWFSFS